MNKKQLTDVVHHLKELGLVGYDIVIPVETMENVMNLTFTDSWEWRGPMLQLRAYLTDLGYFLSERGLDSGSVRFLSEVEIPEHIHKRRLKRYMKMNTDLMAAMRLPTIKLSDTTIKILNHEQDRLSRDISSLAESDPEFREKVCES
jgi:hypothetical protein